MEPTVTVSEPRRGLLAGSVPGPAGREASTPLPRLRRSSPGRVSGGQIAGIVLHPCPPQPPLLCQTVLPLVVLGGVSFHLFYKGKVLFIRKRSDREGTGNSIPVPHMSGRSRFLPARGTGIGIGGAGTRTRCSAGGIPTGSWTATPPHLSAYFTFLVLMMCFLSLARPFTLGSIF